MTNYQEELMAIKEPLQDLLKGRHGKLETQQQEAIDAALQETEILEEKLEQ